MVKNPKPPSKWAEKPYAVGKGKPPVNRQFQPGQVSPNPKGRPRGSKNQTSFQKLLNKRVEVGRTDAGRVIYMTLGEVVDHRLLKKAGDGDLPAIRIVKDFEAKMAAIAYRKGPDPEQIRAELEDEAANAARTKRLSAMLTNYLELAAHLKHAGIAKFVDDELIVEKWVFEEAAGRIGLGLEPSEDPAE